ncbi:30S ribosomal protein S20 [Aerococcus sanguinicola]|uniref:30S ribosomal protein S20 n=1 Tax=unclassified Aerococcus TaxID=2618060 RepID=UPI0008A16C7A|nr:MULTISPECIES: 30S ribosomal protein S20 [unclassified Aerococcus]KAB0647866.1 30S ribosomal protein S20 [Aerococcus sanguinicola]MDK6234205.1 30S ribosomal protein S20 [Aerococcus sp. UMB10185]MDK6804450.1 30S ribosomal protein S20 [Aerococcus sp. UMB7834]MDK6856722.1 30S ribosomal protein S20 [Aerococcus sp. UMB7533]MDK8503222.1 30S ribosomal protein S20 [Aerococcus sp. UMB1112A]
MPQIQSAIKRVRQEEKRTAQNGQKLSKMRTAMKKFEQAAEAGADNAQDLFVQASKELDQAAGKNLIHSNKAAREKSRLAKKLNK